MLFRSKVIENGDSLVPEVLGYISVSYNKIGMNSSKRVYIEPPLGFKPLARFPEDSVILSATISSKGAIHTATCRIIPGSFGSIKKISSALSSLGVDAGMRVVVNLDIYSTK